jgi:hypothetical protein
MRSKKGSGSAILAFIGTLVAIVAIITAVYMFKDHLLALLGELRDKIDLGRDDELPPEESADYADV